MKNPEVAVSVVRTKGNDYPLIKEAVDEALSLIGGISDIIRPGYKVLVKPNLVATPTERLSGGVTRWEVCKAICEAVTEAGGKPFIAESSAIGVDTEDVIFVCEYSKLREEGIPVIDLKSGGQQPAKLKVENPALVSELDTWQIVADADAIITVPVMKTHDQTEVTLGMKNCKGLISDTNKKNFHFLGVVDGVTDIISALKPVLTVIDGTFGQQGLGPIFGETIEMGLIVASKDVVACDAVASLIMGYEVDDVKITVAAASRGLGEKDMDRIDVKGEKIDDVRVRFKRSSEVAIEGVPPSFNLVWSDKACTGCRNTVISVLMDMKKENLLGLLDGQYALVGHHAESEIPIGASPENTVLVGRCAASLGAAGYGRCVIGCPPGNSDTIKGLIGESAGKER
ncbi:MAG: DUF362 domain-containing protein [Clostridiales Family XIII bacterium]|nr:DUF362 domain-containing protein [Clostridiales Family XIII bacterium]